jgi:hypothetical protein
MDSVNLLPFVTGRSEAASDRIIIWRSGSYQAVKQGSWKLQTALRPRRTWLFDLSVDPTERRNLAASRPDQVKRLLAILTRFNREMPPPTWPALIEEPIRIDVPLNAPWRADQEYVYWSN